MTDPDRRSPLLSGQTERAVEETFEAIVFDWDGTAVPDRQSDASVVRHRVEALSAAGVHSIIVTGTHVGNVDGQLRARLQGPGGLFLCCNRGSEVFAGTDNGPELLFRKTATPDEDRALDQAAKRTVEELHARGIEARVVSERINRRKIDLIPTPEWADPKKADINRLFDAVTARLASVGIANLAEVVTLATNASRDIGLANPRITSDVKHVEIGLTDKSDSARWAADWLAQRGITGGLVLIGGDEFGPVGGVVGSDSLMMVRAFARAVVVSVGVEPGGVPEGVLHLGKGPKGFIDLLDEQLSRRASRRVPNIDLDTAWVVPLPTGESMEQVSESLGSLGNGFIGVRGSRDEGGERSAPLSLVNGVYTRDGLLPGPDWTGLERPGVRPGPHERRVLDLRGGTLARFDDRSTGGRSLRFVSVASPHVMGLRAEGPEAHLRPGNPLRPPRGTVDFTGSKRGDTVGAITGEPGAEIAMAAQDQVAESQGRRMVERLATWVANPISQTKLGDAHQLLGAVEDLGFDRLLAEHRESWAQRWSDAEVTIEGDPGSELAARFAVFHLLSAAGDGDETAVGARGLSGDAYAGHVFWDADVFVLPALAAIRPAAARAMLEYRIRRLPAAQALARAGGFDGARFPWESAGDGSDVTPRFVRGKHDELVPIATGSHEEHIVADVAWAATHYATWTGDSSFLAGVGGELVLESARYWASRIQSGADGKGHLYGVIGPDEYHEAVDDNAYTNVMARWNLRRGRRAAPGGWRRRHGNLVDGTGRHVGRRLGSSTPALRTVCWLLRAGATPHVRRSALPRWPSTSCWVPRGWPVPSSSSRPMCSCSTIWCRRR